MANNVNNVVVGKPLVSGGVLVAPLGTALPTTEAATLNAAFVSVGYVTKDGVTSTSKRDSDTELAWGGDTIAVFSKSFTATFKFGLAEFLNPTVQKVLYGDTAVTTTAATATTGAKLAVAVSSTTPPNKSWVIEMRPNGNATAKQRIVIPNAQITDLGDVTYKDDAIASAEVTLTCFPDTSANYYYVYTNDGVTT